MSTEDRLLSALQDFLAMIDSPLCNVSVSTYGSGRGQWNATIREARAAVAAATTSKDSTP